MFRFNYICIISDKVQEILVLGNRSRLVMCQGYCGKQRPCVSFGGKANQLISGGGGEEDWISPKNEGRMLEAWCLAKGELVHMEQAWWPSQETKIRYRKLVFNNKKNNFFFFVDSDLLSDRE